MPTTVVPPPIPHITANIIPLSSILRKFTEFSFTELSYVLSIQPNDEAKKKKLLELIVHLRKEFIRLYVLVKWSKSSSIQFTKLIDLLAYLREQTQFFTNLIWSFQNLNQSLLSAKLPNPDIVTSLEVLNNGEPILPSHNLIKRKNISNLKILKTLKNLNVLLNIKFAMIDNIPKIFLNDYQIKDGRIYINTNDYNFQLSILDENSSFVLIDFKFNFNETIPNCLKLKKIANEMLKKDNFIELEKIFKNYNNSIKFYLIHLKLNKIKFIKHQYNPEKFLIILNYWVNSIVFKNSYVEIGLNKSNDLIFKWFKSGKFVKTYKNVLDIEIFLKDIQLNHSNEILSKINDLSINNSLLQLNTNTGLFYFKNSTPFLNNFLKKLNLDEFDKINENLKNLKLSQKFFEIISILKVTNWQINDSQKLNPTDLKRLLNNDSLPKSIKLFRRNEWPINWQLILLIDVNEIRGFIGIFNKNLNLNHFKELKIENLEYKNSKNFIINITEEILIELISFELKTSNFKHNLIENDDSLEKSGLFLIETNSFVKILNCSNVLYLKYEINSNLNIKIELNGKLNKNFNNLNNMDEIKINNSNGFFQIIETFKFNKIQSLNFLKLIKLNLIKLSKILNLIDILNLYKINLISINLNEILFSYKDNNNEIKLKLANNLIEINELNPHKLCQLSIQEYFNNNGIRKLINYLNNTIVLFELFKKYNDLKFKDFNIEIISKNLNNFNILYFNNKSSELIRLIILIKIVNNEFKFYLSIESNNKLNEVFKFNNSNNKFSKNVILLNDAILVNQDDLENSLNVLNDLIIEKYKK